MAIEIVDLPIKSMVIFHSYVNVYQMVVVLPVFGVFCLTLVVDPTDF
jgi:hypothetical protein